MARRYQLRIEGRQRGPYDLEQLRAWYAAGRIPGEAEIAEEGEGLYYSVEAMRYLLDPEPTPASAPSPSQAPPRSASGGAFPSSPAPSPWPTGSAARSDSEDEAEVWDRLERTAPPAPKTGLSGIAAAIALVSLLAMMFAALREDWVFVAYEPAQAQEGTSAVAIVMGLRGNRLGIAEKGGIPSDPRLKTQGGRLGHASLEARIAADPETFAPLSRGQVEQTRMLMLATCLLVAGAALAAGIGGLVSMSRGAVPSGLGSLALIAGILALICSAGVAFMGIVHGISRLETRWIVWGTGLGAGIVAALASLIAGAILLRASKVLEAEKRRRIEQRRSAARAAGRR